MPVDGGVAADVAGGAAPRSLGRPATGYAGPRPGAVRNAGEPPASAGSAESFERVSAAADSRVPVLHSADWRVAVWRSFLRAHAHLVKRLEHDLVNHHKVPLPSYDVLLQLAEAPDNRLRMSELADAVLLSRSGLTRLVDRLQREGLVERQPDPDDARGLFTVLTPLGRTALRDAAGVHLAGIAELVIARLSEEDLRQLQRLMIRMDPDPPAAPGIRVDRPRT